MLSFDEALVRILDAVPVRPSETIRIADGAGRVLAAPVVARHDQPPFDASAMDGYAVRAADIQVGKDYRVVGQSQAGAGFAGELAGGQVARIFTGAPVPVGADAVIIQENTERDGDVVRFSEAATAGQNIRPRGLDFANGVDLLGPGTLLSPAALALAAAANVAELEVVRRPRVTLLSTGDELVPPGSELKPGQIVGSNNFALRPMFSPVAEVTDLGNAPDDEPALRALLEDALNSDADFIVSSGGASVGDHDLVQPVLKALGVEVGFWKIAMRPGKPLMFGTYGGKVLLALPGNPVSSFVTALTIALPALRRAAGLSQPVPPSLHLPLAVPLPANGPRRHYVRGQLVNEDGQTKVMPFSQTDSSLLSTLSRADVLIVQPEASDALSSGAIVEVLPVPKGA